MISINSEERVSSFIFNNGFTNIVVVYNRRNIFLKARVKFPSNIINKGKIKMKEQNKKYYNCFSYNLKVYLNKVGFTEEAYFTHDKTGKGCWVFKTSPSFYVGLKGFTVAKEMFG